MAQTAIFGPFFATMFLTLLVWMYVYIRRISFITSNKIGQKDLAVQCQDFCIVELRVTAPCTFTG